MNIFIVFLWLPFFFIASSQNCEKRLLASACLSAACLSAWNNSAPTGRIFMEFDICINFENLSRKFKLHQNMKRIKSTLHGGQYTFLIISRSFLPRMKNVSDKICRESQNTHFMFNNFFSNILPFMR